MIILNSVQAATVKVVSSTEQHHCSTEQNAAMPSPNCLTTDCSCHFCFISSPCFQQEKSSLSSIFMFGNLPWAEGLAHNQPQCFVWCHADLECTHFDLGFERFCGQAKRQLLNIKASKIGTTSLSSVMA